MKKRDSRTERAIQKVSADKPKTKPEQGSWVFDTDKKDLISILDNLPCGIAVLGSPFGNVNFINERTHVRSLFFTPKCTVFSRTL